MAKRVQLRRGTTAQINTFTGAVGEVTVDTDKKTLVVHDGTTAGGTPLLKASQLVDSSETVKGVVELATQAEVNTGIDTTRVVTPATLSGAFLQQTKYALNASGNAPIYACRAWVNFDGTGIPSIRASGNVSSITDVGVGRYKANFATVMQDANYAPVVSCIMPSFGLGTPHYCEFSDAVFDGVSVATGNRDAGASNAVDFNNIFVGVFR